MAQNYNFDELLNASKNGGVNDLFSLLSKEDATKISSLLNDKEACEKLLNTPAAKKLFESLTKDGRNNG